MAEKNLEKIIGTPKIGTLRIGDLNGTLEKPILYINGVGQKLDRVNFVIDASNLKSIKNVVSACNLRQDVEAYGTYTKDKNDNYFFIINSVKTYYKQ